MVLQARGFSPFYLKQFLRFCEYIKRTTADNLFSKKKKTETGSILSEVFAFHRKFQYLLKPHEEKN